VAARWQSYGLAIHLYSSFADRWYGHYQKEPPQQRHSPLRLVSCLVSTRLSASDQHQPPHRRFHTRFSIATPTIPNS
jgi:hypothetical protein